MLRALDDEGRGLFVKLVDMGLKPAVLGLLEQEGKCVVQLARSQPNKAVGSHHDVGLENVLVLGADTGVNAVAGNDQVGIGILRIGLGVHLKHQFHIELLTPALQDVE